MNKEEFDGPSRAEKEIAKLKAANDATFERIEKLGGSIDMREVSAARDEHLMAWIYDHVLSPAQREDFLISWHTQLGETLKTLEGEARTRALAVKRKPIIRPSAPGLIVP